MANREAKFRQFFAKHNLELDAAALRDYVENDRAAARWDTETYTARLCFAVMNWAVVVVEIAEKSNDAMQLQQQWNALVTAQSMLIEHRSKLKENERASTNAVVGERQALREALVTVMGTICELTTQPEIHASAAGLRCSLIPRLGHA